MAEDQLELLQKAEHSLSAAQLLLEQGYAGDVLNYSWNWLSI